MVRRKVVACIAVALLAGTVVSRTVRAASVGESTVGVLEGGFDADGWYSANIVCAPHDDSMEEGFELMWGGFEFTLYGFEPTPEPLGVPWFDQCEVPPFAPHPVCKCDWLCHNMQCRYAGWQYRDCIRHPGINCVWPNDTGEVS